MGMISDECARKRAEKRSIVSGLKSIGQRLGIVILAGFFALTVTGLSVSAADPAPGQVGVIYNTGSAVYQQSAADLRATQYLGYYGYGYGYNGYGFTGYNNYYGGTPFYYNGSPNGQNIFTSVGCDTGNFTCLGTKGVGNPYGGFNNNNNNFYGYGTPYGGFNSYNYAYPGFNSYNYGYTGGAPLYGYAMNYNFNFPYSGLPNNYFTNGNCAVGNYTCLFGNLGMSASLPNSFFDAVGCPQGNYACATNQSVFTSKGCTIGNYACIFNKTGKTP